MKELSDNEREAIDNDCDPEPIRAEGECIICGGRLVVENEIIVCENGCSIED